MRLSCPPWSPDMVRECLEPFCVSVTAPRQQAGACDDIEARVAREHPLRRIRELVNGALSKLDEKFDALRYLRVTQEGRSGSPTSTQTCFRCSTVGRPSSPSY